jgi:hypothetical protein
VSPPPWCSRLTWSRPARCGWPRGRFGCGCPRRPRGGTGAGPNRADAWRSPEATCIAEGGPACMKAERADSGNKDVVEDHSVSMMVEDGPLKSFDYFSSPNPSNDFLGGLCFRPETRPPPRLHEGECPRSPLRSLLPGSREELVPAHPTWDVLPRRTRCPSGRRVGVRG